MSNPRLPVPVICDNCKSDKMGLTSNCVVFGKNVGEWPYCYYCDDCSAMVGCHPGTYNPLGYMADGEQRQKRRFLHELFDPIFKLGYLTRDDAYKWLASQLNIAENNCHISQLSKEQLLQAIDLLQTHSKNNYIKFERRKQNEIKRKRIRLERQGKRIGRRKFGN